MQTTMLRGMKSGLAALALLGAAGAGASTLYDGANAGNPLPSQQGWTTVTFPGVTSTMSGTAYNLNTTASNAYQAGNFLTLPAGTLATGTGFDLAIGLDVLAESHTSDNRAGFSLLFVGNDPQHALELGFWTDEVWAYAVNGTSFVRGTPAIVSTAGFHDYVVRVRNDKFDLLVDGTALMSDVPLVDYPGSLSNPLTAVYETPNLLFFGDDTTSGSSNVKVSHVSLSAAPVPAPAALLLFAPALAALGTGLRRRR